MICKGTVILADIIGAMFISTIFSNKYFFISIRYNIINVLNILIELQ